MTKSWRDQEELAELLQQRGRTNRKAVLSPSTALYVGAKLEKESTKPTRDDIARLLCDSKCKDLCYSCLGRANIITQAYGDGMGSSHSSRRKAPSQQASEKTRHKR